MCIIFIFILFIILFLVGFQQVAASITSLLPLFSILSMIGVKNSDHEINLEHKQLSKTGILLFIITTIFFLIYGIFCFITGGKTGLEVFFLGIFPIIYQIPIVVFNVRSLNAQVKKQKEFIERIQEFENTSVLEELHPNDPPSVSALCRKLGLTRREAETSVKLYEGKTYANISEELFVSLSAVKKHAYNIYRKLNIVNSRQLIQKINEIR